MSMERLPEVLIADHSGRTHELDLAWLHRLGRHALEKAHDRALEESVLSGLEEIQVTGVGDSRRAAPSLPGIDDGGEAMSLEAAARADDASSWTTQARARR